MKKKPDVSEDITQPRSLEEAVQMWEKMGIKLPQTFNEFLVSEDDWSLEGGDEQVSGDFKTSEGTSEFAREVNGCEIWLEIPFTTVRVYGKPVIGSVTLFDNDKKRIVCVNFEKGEPATAMTFNEREQSNLPLPSCGGIKGGNGK